MIIYGLSRELIELQLEGCWIRHWVDTRTFLLQSLLFTKARKVRVPRAGWRPHFSTCNFAVTKRPHLQLRRLDCGRTQTTSSFQCFNGTETTCECVIGVDSTQRVERESCGVKFPACDILRDMVDTGNRCRQQMDSRVLDV